MKPAAVITIFAIVVLAQLLVPAKMIFDRQAVLNGGTPYKFKTQPVDPSDPFKGKYIHLNYGVATVPSADTTWSRQETVYVSLATDSLGFAAATHISRDRPTTGDYVEASVNWYNEHDGSVVVDFPFDEFYMNEHKAHDAERVHAEAQRDSLSQTTYALVYVLNGVGVLDNVFINDIPIADYVENR